MSYDTTEPVIDGSQKPRSPRRAKLLRYSRWDAVSVAYVLGAAMVAPVMAWAPLSLGGFTILGCVAALIVVRLLALFSYHNHVHTPLFAPRSLNLVFGLFASAVSGVPATGYRIGHLYHHQHTIDYSQFPLREWLGLGSFRGIARRLLLTADVFRLGMLVTTLRLLLAPVPRDLVQPAPEQRYPSGDAYLTHLFQVTLYQIRTSSRAVRATIFAQALSATLYLAALCAMDWRFFLVVFVPSSFLYGLLAQCGEYGQHNGVDASNARADSVSAYGRLYNVLFLNSGYHQEHHVRPGVHWMKLPQFRQEMAPESERVVVAGSHFTIANLRSRAARRAPAG